MDAAGAKSAEGPSRILVMASSRTKGVGLQNLMRVRKNERKEENKNETEL
jgi:hypothetical protein